MQRQPRRIRTAQWVSWLATFAGIALAIGPNQRTEYDRTLAVLTATYVAIVWYTYVTYRAVQRDELSRLTVDVNEVKGSRRVLVRISNPTRERRISTRVFAEFWRNGALHKLPDLDALRGEVMVFTPGREFLIMLEINPAIGVPDSDYGPAIELGEPENALLRVEIDWVDDLGAEGTIGPDNWLISVLDVGVSQFTRITHSEEWTGISGAIVNSPIDRTQFETDMVTH